MPESAEKPFVHLHCHSDYSLLDGCARVGRYMERCRELNMPAIALTDHGNLFGAMDFYEAATKAGIKPLVGCEIYLVYDHKQSDRPKRDKKRSDDLDDIPLDNLRPEDFPRHQIHHKTLIAQNFEGYQNLVRLVSDAHLNGQYYRPRTDLEKLARFSKGIIALSGCVNGVASQFLIYNDYAKAREATARFIDIFGRENYYIELQNHSLPYQIRILPGLLQLAKEFGLKAVCANDVHYVRREDSAPHDALLCIQTGKLVSEENRMRYPCNEFYLKSRSEMESIFRSIAPEALDNTLEVAEKVDLKIRFGENHYPRFERPVEVNTGQDRIGFDRVLDRYLKELNILRLRDGKEPQELDESTRNDHRRNGLFLFELCKKGLQERYGIDYDSVAATLGADCTEDGKGPPPGPADAAFAAYVCRKLEYELAIITGAGFVDYFLITWDFIDWARRQGIPVGPGRGSGAGCMVAYILRITDIDPLAFGLLFERMLSLERVSPPDFDVDFCMRRRDAVVDYVRQKYGTANVANIITFGTFGAKMIIRDLARVHSIPYADADRIAKMVPNELNISLADALAKSGELQSELRVQPITKRIFDEGAIIEGMVRNTGKHACGIIVSDQPLTDLVPVTLQEGDLTVQYPKGPAEKLGLLKCDFLGLKTLTVLSDAEENIRRTTRNQNFSVEAVPLDDSATYALLNSGRTTGVFQLESEGMQSLCRQLGLSSFEEIIALIALYRPGPMQFIPQYIEGKKDPARIKIPHPKLKNLVSETYGILVYQEQVMQVAQIIAGYTLGGADILRRAMGKKIASLMEQQREIFVQGAQETSQVPRPQALEIFALLEKFAQYGFNKSHSAAYAMLSYRTAYLKANFPVEFMAAVLSCELGDADKTAHFLDECSSMGISVSGPDINLSGILFTPVAASGSGQTPAPASPAHTPSGTILFGLGAIKGVGEGAAGAIIAERESNGSFKDFADFAARIDSKTANRRTLENLIKTGAFDSFGDDRGALLEDLDRVLNEVAELQKDRAAGQINMFDLFAAATPPPANRSKSGSGSCQSRAVMPTAAKLNFEKELLGFYISGHPLDPYAGLVEALNTFSGEQYASLPDRSPYRLCGVIGGLEKKLARKDNRPWAILSLSGRHANYKINIYADAFAQKMEPYQLALEAYKRRTSENAALKDTEEEPPNPLESGKLVVVEGSISQRNGESMLTADFIRPLDAVLPELIEELTWFIEPDGKAEEFIHLLKSSLLSAMGSTSVRLGIAVDSRHAVIADLAGSLKWRLQPRSFTALRKHPAVRGFSLKTTPVLIPERTFGRKKTS